MPSDAFRRQRVVLHQHMLGLGWAAKLGLAIGMAAFLWLMSVVPSLPLPWTPVPFSFQVLAVLVGGAVLGRSWGLLSIAIYILAGALGLQVFADQESTGTAILNPFGPAGYTAGYIYGWAAASFLVGWYVERRSNRMDRRWTVGIATALSVLVGFAVVTLTWLAFQDQTFEAGYSGTRSYLWLFVGMAGLGGVAAAWILKSAHGTGHEKLNLFLAMMAATLVIHLCGILVLKPSLGYTWPQAIALGSTVFLPFDLVKAGLATAASLLFLPSRADETHFLSPRNPR